MGTEIAVAAAAAVLGALGALTVATVLYRRQLRRMERFLRHRPARSNMRLSAENPLPGVPPLAAAINEELDRADAERQRQSQAEQAFQQNLASLSHDIRTPLTGAKDYLQLAASEGDGGERTRYLDLARQRLDAMQTLLDQLFSYCRSLDGDSQGARQTVDALAVLSEVLAGHYPKFVERGWEPTLDWRDGTLPVAADHETLTRIFENLVSNALRYRTGGFSVVQEGRALVFGNDMDATDAASLNVERLFDRFYRGDAARSQSGAGLGLSVVRNLADSLGIQVSATIQGPSAEAAEAVEAEKIADAGEAARTTEAAATAQDPARPNARFRITLDLP